MAKMKPVGLVLAMEHNLKKNIAFFIHTPLDFSTVPLPTTLASLPMLMSGKSWHCIPIHQKKKQRIVLHSISKVIIRHTDMATQRSVIQDNIMRVTQSLHIPCTLCSHGIVLLSSVM